MYDSVKNALMQFQVPLEGSVKWPYQDIIGLVTIGVGCLIEPVGLAMPLPWVGGPTPSTVREEWTKVNAARPAMHFNQYRGLSSLRLTEEGVTELLQERAADFEATLRAGFPAWEDWPADAQLGVLGMAWACGPAFWRKFANFRDYANKRDWTSAARCAGIRTEGNPGVVPRNAQVALCFANAAEIDSPDGYGTPALFWPGHVAPWVPEDTDPRAVPLSVASARAAALAIERFNVELHGLTGHDHRLELAS